MALLSQMLRQPQMQPAQPAQSPWTQGGIQGIISSGGGGAGSTAGQGAGVENAYDKTGNLSSILSREGIDIGPQPDFWGDLNSIVSRLRPRATQPAPAMQQARALRTPTPAYSGPTGERAPARASGYDTGAARFATMVGRGPQSSGVGYDPWQFGMPYSPGNTPFATYSG